MSSGWLTGAVVCGGCWWWEVGRGGVVAMGVMVVGGAVVIDVMTDVVQQESLQPFLLLFQHQRSGLSLHVLADGNFEDSLWGEVP